MIRTSSLFCVLVECCVFTAYIYHKCLDSRNLSFLLRLSIYARLLKKMWGTDGQICGLDVGWVTGMTLVFLLSHAYSVPKLVVPVLIRRTIVTDSGSIFTARGYAKRGICRRRVSVCVCLSVTLRYCIKTAKRRISQTIPRTIAPWL